MDPISLAKTSFLWALELSSAEKTNIASIYFDMSGITGLIKQIWRGATGFSNTFVTNVP